MSALELLKKQLEIKSQGRVSQELKVSKTTINLIIKEKYPNPKNIYKKIIDKYGDEAVEIVGVDTEKSAIDLYKEVTSEH